MSIIRPEVRDVLWRWREVVVIGVVILFGLRLVGRGVDLSSLTYLIFGFLICGTSAAMMFFAILRARMHRPVQAVGAVEIKERLIAYMTPDGGSVVSLDDLTMLEIVTTRHTQEKEHIYWVLSHLAGDPLLVPASAQGTDALFDAFSALPGVRMDIAVRAVSSQGRERFLIWEK